MATLSVWSHRRFRSLSAVMDDTFQKFAPLIPAAIQNLDAFSVWYRENFDTNLLFFSSGVADHALRLGPYM